MYLKQIILNSLEYNLWVNEQYYKWLSDKSDILLTTHVESSFSSILHTLHHILQTQEYWWSVIKEQQDIAVEREVTDLDRGQIFDSLIGSSRLLVSYFKELDQEELLKTVEIKNEWFTCNFSKFEYVQQLTYHAAYHRGQVVTIGRALGVVDAPLTDYNFWNLYKDRVDMFA
ncbi:DUF1572 family protein [Sphingobacterium shayense]|uniref:DinB family protein n=1 Tax=Sphingobacterium shayense TaxID=626343 RepID=UPI0015548E6B|nr:DinB family protein [Sphingobacterium shayense]NQD69781.1 DUF1572 family protein [Sphingobacterium shayense]